jgi:hypothetical protein
MTQFKRSRPSPAAPVKDVADAGHDAAAPSAALTVAAAWPSGVAPLVPTLDVRRAEADAGTRAKTKSPGASDRRSGEPQKR